MIDYTGLEAKFLLDNYGINLGTTVAGAVMERALADGHALVTVDLHVHNALGWAFNSNDSPTGDPNITPLAFGARVLDIVGGAAPALGDVHFHAEFVNSAPGAPLPDLVAVNAAFCTEPFPIPLSWSDIQFIAIEASIKGTLHALSGFPEGTPGMLAVKQTGLLGVPPQPFPKPRWDQYPVESIDLKPIGR